MAVIDNVSKEIDNYSMASVYRCAPDRCCDFIVHQNENLKIIHINIRSISKNFDQFIVMLATTKTEFDIVVLTECWLKVSGPLPVIQGYNAQATVNNKLQNDGVVIYSKASMACVIHEPPYLDANCLVCTVGSTAIICIYRSPSYHNLD